MPKRSVGEALFYQHLCAEGMRQDWTEEYRFHPSRKWRFDFANCEQKIAVEIEGGIWIKGAHTRGKHFDSDCEKYNEATKLGWRVFRFSTGKVKDGTAINFIKRVLDDND